MNYKPQFSVEVCGINELKCICTNPPEDCEFAFYVFRDGKDVGHYSYASKAEMSYWAQESGKYRFKMFIRNRQGEKLNFFSQVLVYEKNAEIYCNNTPPKDGLAWIRNVGNCMMEIWENRKRMFRISLFNYKVLNQDAYLGSFWNILHPLIQIATYWFVFGIGIRGGKDVNGFPYLLWMLSGLIPWFFMSQCITKGAGAIRKRGINALKMRYPVTTMPLEEVLVAFYSHIVMLLALLISFFCFGIMPSVYWINLIYYMLFAVTFFTALGMVTSVLTMIALDFQKLLNSLIRLLFYVTPILWSMDNLPGWVKRILNLNPCLYIVNGFRDSLIYHVPFFVHYKRMAFFWGVTILLIIIGSNLQEKYKKYFLDME